MKNITRLVSTFFVSVLVLLACTGGGGGGSSDSSSASGSLVLGQSSPTSLVIPSLYGICYSGKPTVIGTKLIVPDSCNSRVLIWNSIPTQNYQQANVVLGQSDFYGTAANYDLYTPSASTLSYPTSVATDGTKLIVSDTENHRVLIWNTVPTSNGQAADVVLGQADFVTVTAQTTSASSLNYPHGVYVLGTKLFVADSANHRVLIWNTIPTSSNQAADVVIGQTNFTDNTSNADMNGPDDLASDGTKLVVVGNQMNPRIWNTIPTANGVSPDLNMGNQPTLSGSWNGVTGVTFGGGKLIIAGDNSTGVFVWNSIPTSVPTWADYEVGSHNSATPSATNMPDNGKAYTDGTRLFVVDRGRLLIWNTIPANSSTAADVVLGQPNMTTNRNNYHPTNAQTLNSPTGVLFIGNKLITSEADNHRILIWNSVPTTNQQAADVVLGQTSMSTFSSGASATELSSPWGIGTDGTKLFVADTNNNRVLIWNTVPTSSTTAADVVLGQTNMTNSSSGVSSTEMSYPNAVTSNGTVLVVADSQNHRVLIWNTVPTSSTTAADIVLGQSNMTSNSSAAGSTGLNWPDAVRIYGTKLVVSDSGNCRILIWNTIPTSNAQAADVVIGQPDFTSTSCGSASASVIYDGSIAMDSAGRLFLADYVFNRVLVWDSIPTTNNAAADHVLGQPDFTSYALGRGAAQFNNPWGIAVKDNYVWVADTLNYRILKIAAP